MGKAKHSQRVCFPIVPVLLSMAVWCSTSVAQIACLHTKAVTTLLPANTPAATETANSLAAAADAASCWLLPPTTHHPHVSLLQAVCVCGRTQLCSTHMSCRGILSGLDALSNLPAFGHKHSHIYIYICAYDGWVPDSKTCSHEMVASIAPVHISLCPSGEEDAQGTPATCQWTTLLGLVCSPKKTPF